MVEHQEIKKWHPVYTQSRAEKKAYQALLSKDIEAYLPLQRQLKQWSDRKKWVDEPLLRSYLFVHINQRQQTEVLMTSGISRFLYFSGKIATMPDRQISDLKLLLASPYELKITEEDLRPGELVEIKAGPLKGIRAEIIEYRSHKQLLLRLGDMQRSIIVNVSAAFLERIH
uniref:UpxY family transcription antiterminator n=1 Tax=Pedobacter schmidteae TaxID=2201271 RepID=UPI000EACD0CC|nr:UpxY family transcription antiterminator [Pedobacter schmidteae]